LPHILIEYSSNLEGRFDIQSLVDRLHDAALETGVFPLGGTRTRAFARDLYRIADGDPENAFVHVMVRIGAGRDHEVRQSVTDRLFEETCDALAEVYQASPLAISFELQEIEPDFSRKKNNLHHRLSSRNNRT